MTKPEPKPAAFVGGGLRGNISDFMFKIPEEQGFLQAGIQCRHAEVIPTEVSFLRNKNEDTIYEANFRVIEWLQAELVESVGLLFKSLLRAGGEAAADALSTIVIICYVLGRRAGINYQTIDMHIMHKMNSTVNEASELEQMYGDLTELKKYFDRRESKTR